MTRGLLRRLERLELGLRRAVLVAPGPGSAPPVPPPPLPRPAPGPTPAEAPPLEVEEPVQAWLPPAPSPELLP